MAAICRAAFMSPATSTSMSWRAMGATNSGSSTPASVVFARLTRSIVFIRAGARRLSARLAPEDRCHLNGIAIVDGRPKYVTALGETDTLAGWRENKARGGILIDVESNEILLRGLSMPHSPRWHQGKLWVLESGEGSLAQVDLEQRTWRTIARLPGFTRGIDFVGPLAFIGLSKVRESAVFSGIPLVEQVRERTCGVWIINVETGTILGFLRFEAGVQEIFAVQILRGMRFPELLEWNDQRLADSYVLPADALADMALSTEAEQLTSPAPTERLAEVSSNGKLETMS